MNSMKKILLIGLLCINFSTQAQTDYEDIDIKNAKALLKDAGVQGMSISKDKLKTYFENTYFKNLDTNSDLQISLYELKSGYLHCDTDKDGNAFICRDVSDTPSRIDDYRNQEFKLTIKKQDGSEDRLRMRGVIDQQSLFSNHISLKSYINQRAEYFFQNANPVSPNELTLKEVAKALKVQRERNHYENASESLKRLYANDKASGVKVAVERALWEHYFNKLDTDFSGEIEISEYATGLNSNEEIKEFFQILQARQNVSGSVNDTYGISKQHFIGEGEHGISGPILVDDLGAKVSTKKLKARFDATDLTKASSYIHSYGTIEEASKYYRNLLKGIQIKLDEKIAEKAVGDGNVHYLKGRGFVFGSVAYDVARKQKILSYDKSFAVVRLIKDYTKFDSNAEPASLAWKKENGKSSTDKSQSIIDGAIRVDLLKPSYHNESETTFNISIGAANSRSGSGKEKKISNKGFLTGNYYHRFQNADYWKAGLLQTSFVVAKNEITRQKSNHLVIEYEPVITFPYYFTTGVKAPIDPYPSLSWYFRPRIGFEEMDIKQQPLPTDERDPTVDPYPDTNFLTWSMEIGFDIGDDIDLVYSLKKWHANAGSDSNFSQQTLAIEVPILSSDNVMLTLSYKQGETPTEQDTLETFQLGIGVLF